MLASSCTNNSENTSEETKPNTKTEQSATETNTSSITVQLGSNDTMLFDQSTITVQEGQTVTVVLTHSGKMSEDVMGHNFVLLQQGTDISAFGRKAMNARETEYIPEGNEVIAHTEMIGGGETTQVTFTAPPKGEYDFICSFPGHYAVMKGKFIVE